MSVQVRLTPIKRQSIRKKTTDFNKKSCSYSKPNKRDHWSCRCICNKVFHKIKKLFFFWKLINKTDALTFTCPACFNTCPYKSYYVKICCANKSLICLLRIPCLTNQRYANRREARKACKASNHVIPCHPFGLQIKDL